MYTLQSMPPDKLYSESKSYRAEIPFPGLLFEGSSIKSVLLSLYPLYRNKSLKSLKLLTFLFNRLKIFARSEPLEVKASPYNSLTRSSLTELLVSEKKALLKDA